MAFSVSKSEARSLGRPGKWKHFKRHLETDVLTEGHILLRVCYLSEFESWQIPLHGEIAKTSSFVGRTVPQMFLHSNT